MSSQATFTVTIPTDPFIDMNEPGVALATLFRLIADRVETEVRVLPSDRGEEWRTETYRQSARVEDVLVGAVYEIEGARQ